MTADQFFAESPNRWIFWVFVFDFAAIFLMILCFLVGSWLIAYGNSSQNLAIEATGNLFYTASLYGLMFCALLTLWAGFVYWKLKRRGAIIFRSRCPKPSCSWTDLPDFYRTHRFD